MRKIRSLVVFMLTFFMAICLFACAKTGNYKFARVDWKEDGTGATVILVDESDSSKKKEVEVDVTLKAHKDATCDEPAKNIYEVTYEGVKYTKEFSVGNALGHDWEFVRFDWSTNCKTANAVLVCKKDSTHTKEVPATMASVKKSDPTCGAKGVTTYTATYETHTESQDVADIEEIDHDYQFDHFVWNDDYTAKAILVCKNNSEHTKEKNAVVTSKIVTPATCEAKGSKEYTATYLTYSDTKNAEIEALGHNYQFDHFNWADDYKSAVAVLVCANDHTHTKKVDAVVTSEISKAPTCEANGITTYTATYETHTDTRNVSDIEKIGHKYEFDHFVWAEDYKTAKAVFVCENDSTHTKEESVNVVENQFDDYNSYTATYGDFSETRKVSKTSEEIYTVDFRNADNELISTTDYKKGETVVVPETPTMDDETYTYVFKSWDKEVSLTAEGSVTYKAVYEKTYKEYEIIFETEDHKEISKAKYHYGDDIVFPTKKPEKEADSKYTYEFAGWNQMPTVCYGNRTYTAMYRPVYIEYEITFVNFDDKEISTKKYHYDDVVVVPTNPTKPADNTYTYEFKCWDSEVVNVNGNKVYKAEYKEVYIDYVVEFVDAETKKVLDTKTYHYNDELVVPTTFTKEADNTYTYEFEKFDGEVATKVTSNVTYAVIFTKTYIEYEIIFETENHKEISKAKYHYGDDIVFPTKNPEKEADSKYTYEFAGWNQMPTVCMGNMTYTAMYRPVYIDYEITFVDYNDKEISTKKYHYDDVVVVPANPTRSSDNTYTYEFKAWDSEVTKVDGAKTYKAVYEATYIDYEIAFVDYNDKELSTDTYHYGAGVVLPENPTRDADNTYTYEFKGWTPEVTKVDGNKTYKAEYTATFIEYTVVFNDNDGKAISTAKYHYGDTFVTPWDKDYKDDYVWNDYNDDTYYYQLKEFVTDEFEIADSDSEYIVHDNYEFNPKYDQAERTTPKIILENSLDRKYVSPEMPILFKVEGSNGEVNYYYSYKGENSPLVGKPKHVGEYTLWVSVDETIYSLEGEASFDFSITYESYSVVFMDDLKYCPQVSLLLDEYGIIIDVMADNDFGYLFLHEVELVDLTVEEFINEYYDFYYNNHFDILGEEPCFISTSEEGVIFEEMTEAVHKYMKDDKYDVVSITSLRTFLNDYYVYDIPVYEEEINNTLPELFSLYENIATKDFKEFVKVYRLLVELKSKVSFYCDILAFIKEMSDEDSDDYKNAVKYLGYFDGAVKALEEYFEDYYVNLYLYSIDASGEYFSVKNRIYLAFDQLRNIARTNAAMATGYVAMLGNYAKTLDGFMSQYKDEYDKWVDCYDIIFEKLADEELLSFINGYIDYKSYNENYYGNNYQQMLDDLSKYYYTSDENHYFYDGYVMSKDLAKNYLKYVYQNKTANVTFVVFESDSKEYSMYSINGLYTKEELQKTSLGDLSVRYIFDEVDYSISTIKGSSGLLGRVYFNVDKDDNLSMLSAEGEIEYYGYLNAIEYIATFTINKLTDGSKRLYLYVMNWTYEELLSIDVSYSDTYTKFKFYEKDGCYYLDFDDKPFKLVLDFEEESGAKCLKEFELDLSPDDYEVKYYSVDEESGYIFVLVTVDCDAYGKQDLVFIYEVEGPDKIKETIDAIYKKTIEPFYGLSGTLTWKVKENIIFTDIDDEGVYIVKDDGKELEEHKGTEVISKSETTKTVKVDGKDVEFTFIDELRYDLTHKLTCVADEINYHYVVRDDVIVVYASDINYILKINDSGEYELVDLADQAEVKYYGYDRMINNNNNYIICAVVSGQNIAYYYDNFIDLENLSSSKAKKIREWYIEDDILYIGVPGEYECFKVEGNKLSQIAPTGMITVTFKNYDGSVISVYYIEKGDAVLNEVPDSNYVKEPESTEDTFFSFDGWDHAFDEELFEDTVFVAQFEEVEKYDRKLVITNDISKNYDGVHVSYPKYDYEGTGSNIVEFKLKDEDDDCYTKEMPGSVGKYVVRVTVKPYGKYKGAVAEKEFSITYSSKTIIELNYLNSIYLICDEYGIVTDVIAADEDVRPIIEEHDFVELDYKDACSLYIETLNDLGYFYLYEIDTQTNQSYVDLFVNIYQSPNIGGTIYNGVNGAIVNTIEKLASNNLINSRTPFEYLSKNTAKVNIYDYLYETTMHTQDEIAKMSDAEIVDEIIRNLKCMKYKSYVLNKFMSLAAPAYVYVNEISFLLQNAGKDADQQMMNEFGAFTYSFVNYLKPLHEICSPTNTYLVNRSNYYDELTAYREGCLNNNFLILQFMDFMTVYGQFNYMNNEALPAINKAQNGLSTLRDEYVALHEKYAAEIAQIYEKVGTTRDECFANFDYSKIYIDPSYDLDTHDIGLDIIRLKDFEGIKAYYYNDEYNYLTYIFVKDAFGTDGLDVCFLYNGLFDLLDCEDEDHELIRFFEYRLRSYNVIALYDYIGDMLTSYWLGDSEELTVQQPVGELKYVGHAYQMGMEVTYGFFVEDDDPRLYGYMGNYSFDVISKGLVSPVSESDADWVLNGNLIYIYSNQEIQGVFIQDKDDSRIFEMVVPDYDTLEVKHYVETPEDIYVFYETEEKEQIVYNYLNLSSYKKEDILAGKVTPIDGLANNWIWDLEGGILRIYVNGKVRLAFFATYDKDTNTYSYSLISKEKVKDFEVVYTYNQYEETDPEDLLFVYIFAVCEDYYENVVNYCYQGSKAFDSITDEAIENMIMGVSYPDGYIRKAKWYSDNNNNQPMIIVEDILTLVPGSGQDMVAIGYGSDQLIKLSYVFDIYLHVSRNGYVSKAFSDDEAGNLFLEDNNLEGMYYTKAVQKYLMALYNDGYFKLYIDYYMEVFEETGSFYDTVTISYYYDSVASALESIASIVNKELEENNIKIVTEKRSAVADYQSITLYSDAEMAFYDTSESFAMQAYMGDLERAYKYNSKAFNTYALYLYNPYTFSAILEYIKDEADNNKDLQDAARNAYYQFGALLFTDDDHKENWTFTDYEEFMLANDSYIYYRNSYYQRHKLAIERIKKGYETSVLAIDLERMFNDYDFMNYLYNNQLGQISLLYNELKKVRDAFYAEEVVVNNLEDEYDILFGNSGEYGEDVIIGLAMDDFMDYLESLTAYYDVNVYDLGFDFTKGLKQLTDYYTVQYTYYNSYRCETWEFRKMNMNNIDYYNCFVYVNGKISRFFTYKVYSGSSNLVYQDYKELDSYTFDIDSNKELVLVEPTGKIEYVYHYYIDNFVYTYALNSDNYAYIYSGKYTYNQLKNSDIDVNTNRRTNWMLDPNNIIYLEIFEENVAVKLVSSYEDYFTLVEYVMDYDKADINHVIYDSKANTTYICFILDGTYYAYGYDGEVTEEALGKKEEATILEWKEKDDVIAILNQHMLAALYLHEDGKYTEVNEDDIKSYEVKYYYSGEEYKDLFVVATTYSGIVIHNKFSCPIAATDEEINQNLYDVYHPTESLGMISVVSYTWVESDSAVAVIMRERRKAPVISAKYLKQENSKYLTGYEVKTQELKYTYSDDEYIYKLYIENGLMICYSYDKNDQEGDIVNSYCWLEHKGWGVIITIDAFTEGEYFRPSDTDPTILVLAGKDSGTPALQPISGGGRQPISGNPKSPIMA